MRGSPSLKPATVRRYLEALRAKQLVAAATELTYGELLADFLRTAAGELGFRAVTINAELSMPSSRQDVWKRRLAAAPRGHDGTLLCCADVRRNELLATGLDEGRIYDCFAAHHLAATLRRGIIEVTLDDEPGIHRDIIGRRSGVRVQMHQQSIGASRLRIYNDSLEHARA